MINDIDPHSLSFQPPDGVSAASRMITVEDQRLAESRDRTANWQRWGPYLSERQWGTVREDYSADGNCWDYFPHDHARLRAYRWGEDGLLGICDRQCRLCFGLALWNGRDPILKERLFGLTGPEGNHGEDVKECYYYLDSTPTHSYMKALYKYPQSEFPYARIVEENRRRSKRDPEFELADTGVFDENRYFDVFAEYAKASPDDMLIRITIANRGPQTAALHLLPTLWFRNTWSWGCTHEGCEVKPTIRMDDAGVPLAQHVTLGDFSFRADTAADGSHPTWLFTENETNTERLFGTGKGNHHAKDAFHDFVVNGQADAANARQRGTKLAALYELQVPAEGETTIQLRLTAADKAPPAAFGVAFNRVFAQRRAEADDFYARRRAHAVTADDESNRVARQAYAGLLWSKQFYHYVVKDWLDGDPEQLPPPASRRRVATTTGPTCSIET